jgi:hypothetical protein
LLGDLYKAYGGELLQFINFDALELMIGKLKKSDRKADIEIVNWILELFC